MSEKAKLTAAEKDALTNIFLQLKQLNQQENNICMMKHSQILLAEIKQEAIATRKLLELSSF
jgi:hypothetical protein